MKKILVIGGHGMLGRPVVRRLVGDGFFVRALARDVERARKLIPQADVVAGDLESVPSLDAALQGCEGVYVSVDTPPGAKFKPETDGLRNLVTAAKNHGHPRLLILSVLGANDPAAEKHPWWHTRVKAEALRIARESGLPWTAFGPTWFMESLPLFVKKGSFVVFDGPRLEPYWIAGDDYGRMISAALTKEVGLDEYVPVQGPAAIPVVEAGLRFTASYDSRVRVKQVPFWIMRLAGLVNAQAREFVRLMTYYGQYAEPAPDGAVWERFAAPAMRIEDYAAYVRSTHDFPQK